MPQVGAAGTILAGLVGRQTYEAQIVGEAGFFDEPAVKLAVGLALPPLRSPHNEPVRLQGVARKSEPPERVVPQ